MTACWRGNQRDHKADTVYSVGATCCYRGGISRRLRCRVSKLCATLRPAPRPKLTQSSSIQRGKGHRGVERVKLDVVRTAYAETRYAAVGRCCCDAASCGWNGFCFILFCSGLFFTAVGNAADPWLLKWESFPYLAKMQEDQPSPLRPASTPSALPYPTRRTRLWPCSL